MTSIKDGYTDRWIFLPFAGDFLFMEKNWDGTELYEAGTSGTYWSSSLFMGSNIVDHSIPYCAWYFYLYLDEDFGNRTSTSYGFRCPGAPVRAVCGE